MPSSRSIVYLACLLTGYALVVDAASIPGGEARGNIGPLSCVGQADGNAFCKQAYALGYFGSGVTDAYCKDGQTCVVACKPGWKCANGKDGCGAVESNPGEGEFLNHSCVNGPDINICKDFFSADSTGCACHGDPAILATGQCGCPDNKEMVLNALNQAVCPA